MIESVSDLRTLVHIALDEIAGSDLDSSFDTALNSEIDEALKTAALELSEELPDALLMPTVVTDSSIVLSSSSAVGSITLPVDFLRLLRLRMTAWDQDVTQLTDPTGNEAKMQASEWTRGTPQKPVAILGKSATDTDGEHRLLNYYSVPAVTSGGVTTYNHSLSYLVYVPVPTVASSTLQAGIHDRAKPLLINRACAIIMDGKQNGSLADRFRAMSVFGRQQ